MKKRREMLEELLGLTTIYTWKADAKKGEQWKVNIFQIFALGTLYLNMVWWWFCLFGYCNDINTQPIFWAYLAVLTFPFSRIFLVISFYIKWENIKKRVQRSGKFWILQSFMGTWYLKICKDCICWMAIKSASNHMDLIQNVQLIWKHGDWDIALCTAENLCCNFIVRTSTYLWFNTMEFNQLQPCKNHI